MHRHQINCQRTGTYTRQRKIAFAQIGQASRRLHLCPGQHTADPCHCQRPAAVRIRRTDLEIPFLAREILRFERIALQNSFIRRLNRDGTGICVEPEHQHRIVAGKIRNRFIADNQSKRALARLHLPEIVKRQMQTVQRKAAAGHAAAHIGRRIFERERHPAGRAVRKCDLIAPAGISQLEICCRNPVMYPVTGYIGGAGTGDQPGKRLSQTAGKKHARTQHPPKSGKTAFSLFHPVSPLFCRLYFQYTNPEKEKVGLSGRKFYINTCDPAIKCKKLDL